MSKTYYLIVFLLIAVLSACTNKPEVQLRFESITPEKSNVLFNNALVISDSMNFFEYGYFYMGGGVSAGDLNGDGFSDLYFTGNMVENKLYLNKGNLRFEDVTKLSDVEGDSRWMTGSTLVDINNDGLLDIYVSVSGKWESRKNLLFVNQGNNADGIPQFKELADEYGIADEGYSIQSTFLDYDGDGDLDLFVGNYPPSPFNAITRDYVNAQKNLKHKQSDHLYRNNGDNTFSDVTKESGIFNYGLTIGVIASDLNNDGHTDLYLSNDFHTPDRIFLNNGDGTFTDHLKSAVQHTAFFGMGIDAGDVNNDGLTDLIQVDMTPADNFRSKANMSSMDVPSFWAVVNAGYHYQYMYNTLQICNGIRDGVPFYSDIAKLSGMDKTDWSWAPLLADLDNDGLKDLFVTNGTRRDINNKDFFNWLERIDVSLKLKYKELTFKDVTKRMPFKKVDNYVFRNENGLKFKKANEDWGLTYEGFSNGAAYADLDNDGDLDLILNNVDSTAAIFENKTSQITDNHFLQITLKGPELNPMGAGCKVYLSQNGDTQYHEHTLTRGYQSSVDPVIHFGVENTAIDQLRIVWPDGREELMKNPRANQRIIVDYSNAIVVEKSETKPVARIFTKLENITNHKHEETLFNDYKREVLLPHKMSELGPAIAIADVDGNGLDDFYIGGAKGYSGYLFTQSKDGFEKIVLDEQDALQEDIDAIFADVDNDGDQDLYIVSGGNEDELNSEYYLDRLLLNNGKGSFERTSEVLPNIISSGGRVKPLDFDQDGDVDFLVCGRQMPGHYPNAGRSYLLENKLNTGVLVFEDVTSKLIPELTQIGMVTDAVVEDINNDGESDLILVGEWMPLVYFEKQEGQFVRVEKNEFKQTNGWWNTIAKGDFDNDGDMDFVVGNLGLNYKYKASKDKSFDIYASDFDNNGNHDIVLGYYEGEKQFPVRGFQCSSEQMPELKARFNNKYNVFASAELSAIYSKEKLSNSDHYQAWNFASSYMENLGNGEFKLSELPLSAQYSSINAFVVEDFNGDGTLDILIGGNQFESEIETPRNDGSYLSVLLGDGNGQFTASSYAKSGLYNPHEVRQLRTIKIGETETVIVVNNNGPLQFYGYREKK